MIRDLKQRGEISLTLSVIAIVVSVIGIALGSISVQQNLNSSTEAQEGTFSYQSTLMITDVNKNPLRWENGMNWETSIVGEVTSGEIRDDQNYAILEWPGPAPERFRNQLATVDVEIPPGYKVIDHICVNQRGTTCDNIQVDKNNLIISNLPIVENASIVYGWVIAESGCTLDRPDCELENVSTSISSETDPVSISWDTPRSCGTPGPQEDDFDPAKNDYLVRVVADGGRSLICAKRVPATSTSTDCRPGIDADQPLDQSRQEVIQQKWIPGERYLVQTQVESREFESCVSQRQWSGDFEFSIESPTAVPTAIPTIEPTAVATGQPTTQPTVQPTTRVTTHPTAIPSIPTDIPACKVQVEECSPKSARVWNNYPTADSVRYVWNLPMQCEDYTVGQSTFIVDVVNNEGNVVCSSQSQTNNATCTLGDEIPGRPLDKGSSEYVNKKWDKNEKYTARVYLQDSQHACVSEPAESTFTYIEETSSCEHIRGNGDFRILLAPHGYEAYEDFKSDAYDAILNVEATNLPQEVKEKLTFVSLKNTDIDFKCSRGEKVNRAISCDYTTATQARQVCDAESILIIVNDKKHGGAAMPSMNMAVVTAPSVIFTAHEFGHSIVGLYDEYLFAHDGEEPGRVEFDPSKPNCAAESDTTCEKWGSEGCFEGCTYTNWRRPSEDSIMRSFGFVFNKPSLQAWIDTLDQLKIGYANSTQELSVYYNTLHLVLSQTAQNELEVASVAVEQEMYPQPQETKLSEYFYDLSIKDAQGSSLYVTQIPSHAIQVHGAYEVRLLDNIDVYLPYFESANGIQVTSSNQVIFSMDLDQYSLSSPSFAGDLCGNSVCDAQIGENQNSCSKDCGSHLAKSEDERADLNEDGIVLTNDLSILLDSYLTPNGDINGDGNTNAIDYQIQIQYFGEETISEKARQLRMNPPDVGIDMF